MCRGIHPGGDYNEDAFGSWVREGSLHVAEAGGRAAGMIAVSVRGRAGWLQGARVDPALQGRGLGGRMYRLAERAAASLGARSCGALAEPGGAGEAVLAGMGYAASREVRAYVAGDGRIPADWGAFGEPRPAGRLRGAYLDSWEPRGLRGADAVIACGGAVLRASRSRHCPGASLEVIRAGPGGLARVARAAAAGARGRPARRWWRRLVVLSPYGLPAARGLREVGRYRLMSRGLRARPPAGLP